MRMFCVCLGTGQHVVRHRSCGQHRRPCVLSDREGVLAGRAQADARIESGPLGNGQCGPLGVVHLLESDEVSIVCVCGVCVCCAVLNRVELYTHLSLSELCERWRLWSNTSAV